MRAGHHQSAGWFGVSLIVLFSFSGYIQRRETYCPLTEILFILFLSGKEKPNAMNGNLRLISGLLFALLPALLLGGHHYTSTHTSTPDSAIIRASLPKKQTAHLLLTTNNKLKNRGFFRDSQQGPANGQPMAEDDIYRLLQDQPLWIEPIGVLENDHDPDGEQLAARIVQPPQHGVV